MIKPERRTRLPKAMLKRAFEGKLVPQEPNDELASALLERIRTGSGNALAALVQVGPKHSGKSQSKSVTHL